jgi:phage repressor protein C with HTH and peptisase S24 domain
MTTEYGKRLRSARKAAGLTQEALSKKTGIAQSTISTAEREGSGSSDTPVYANACGVSALWLATGEGEMHGNNRTPKEIELENNPEYPAIRRVKLKAQAGASGYAVEYQKEDDGPPIVFRADWYKSKGYKPEKMLALRVTGESMAPSMYEGDLIVINTTSTAPKDGAPFLVNYEGEIVVKRLTRDDGLWWLTSDNPDQRRYGRKVCNGGTEIIGEVVYRQTERV